MNTKDFFNLFPNTPDTDYQMDESFPFDEINSDLLNSRDQENLNQLFETSVEQPSFRYPRIPVFANILDILKKNNINLDELDLNDEQVKIKILNNLYNEIINSGNYAINSVLMLWEIINSLEYLYFITDDNSDIIPYYKKLLNINYDLFENSPDLLTLKCLDRNILELSKHFPDEPKKFIEISKRFLDFVEANNYYQTDYAASYLSLLESLIFSLKENKLENEIEQYLSKFVNYIKKIDIEDDEIVFIISSVTNSLVTSLFEIELNQEEIQLVKELIKIYQNLLNQSLSQDDKSFLLITLSYLYFVLRDFNKVTQYLKLEYELNENNEKMRNPVLLTGIMGLINQLISEVGEEQGLKLIKSIYGTDDQIEIVQLLTNQYIDPKLLADLDSIDDKIQIEIEELRERDAQLEKFSLKNENEYNLIPLASNRLALVFNDLINGDINQAVQKLDSIQEISKKIKDFGLFQDYKSIDFLESLLRESIPLVKNDTFDINEFINKIKKSMLSYHNENKGNEINFNPVPFLLGLAESFILKDNKDLSLKLVKEAYSLMKIMEPYYEDFSDFESLFSVLSHLRGRFSENKLLNWTDSIIDEVFNMLIELGISPKEFIKNNIYFNEAEIAENLGSYKRAIKLYQKSLATLFRYPNYENILTITDYIGRAYFRIGTYQNHLREIDFAIDSFNKAISYLTKHNASQTNYLHLLDLLNSNLTLSEIYIKQKEFKQAQKIVGRIHNVFKNTVLDISDDMLFSIYLDIIDQERMILENLHLYQESRNLFNELAELLTKKYIDYPSFYLVLIILDHFFVNQEGEQSSLSQYIDLKDIERIYKKFIQLNLFEKAKEFDFHFKKPLFDLSFFYIDSLIKNNKSVSEIIINRTIDLCFDLLSEMPENSEELRTIITNLEIVKRQQKLFRSINATKKKKTYKKKPKIKDKRRKKRK